jgi:Sec-independent protein secretion pathway component TatC
MTSTALRERIRYWLVVAMIFAAIVTVLDGCAMTLDDHGWL